jgi:transposase InsO family protein
VSVAAFISSPKTDFGIDHATSCRALGVSRSWFYTWNNRGPTAREQRRKRLDEDIKRHFDASGGTYGSPRITQDLHAEGWKVSQNTVAARMVELGLAGRTPKKPRSLTRQGKRPAPPDLVGRKFTAVAPDLLWVGDGTMIMTGEGPLYLATVEDLFGRRLLG